jgi:hypothetical protein
MAQHRRSKHHGTGAVGNGAANRLVGDGCAQLGSGSFKQLIAGNNLPVPKARNANPSNEDQNQRDDIDSKA